MDYEIIQSIPVKFDAQQLSHQLHISPGSEEFFEFQRLIDTANQIAQPKALYRVGFIDSKTTDSVIVDGVVLKSRILRINLETANRVFIFLATCGSELEHWSNSINDLLAKYWADMIKETALYRAMQVVMDRINEQYEAGKTSTMSPGSLPDFPLPAQREVFRLLDNMYQQINVQITDSFLMIPNKTVSGILFPTEETFRSCQLCKRPNCPNRSTPYDPSLFKQKYKKVKTSFY